MACVRVSKPQRSTCHDPHANIHRPHTQTAREPTRQLMQTRKQRTTAGAGPGCQSSRGCCHLGRYVSEACVHDEQEQALRVHGSASPAQHLPCTQANSRPPTPLLPMNRLCQLCNTCKHATTNAHRHELGQVSNCVGDAATQLVADQTPVWMVNSAKRCVRTDQQHPRQH